ncbi:glycosyltransferase family 2 protein [Paenibacillus mesotrionivorans]|uniref:Glycosyltransferase family 2 protein n=1 Tax=Paenibacillus mesotrionivorans TaxID=3160968 RepID=A0ACC7NVD1_9BACL
MIDYKDRGWEIPLHSINEFKSKSKDYCVCVPVINEGEKIKKQILRMSPFSEWVDIIILDGGSTDGSLNPDFLMKNGIRALLTKQDKGKLSAQLRMGFGFALQQGYKGIITVDGNGKDGVEAIPEFVRSMEQGFDFVQGSRYIPGGTEINTPLSRKLAIKIMHAPFLSLLSRHHYTDTTNGFRGHSSRFLLDHRLQPFRSIFDSYELLAYITVKAPRLGYKVKEIPVSRIYPEGKIPTKISPWKGNLLLIKILWRTMLGVYDPINHKDSGNNGLSS